MAFLLRLRDVFLLALASTAATGSPLTDDQKRAALNTYDYVVVGGGTAGLTIAARLAENPNLQVAVVEAGGLYQVNGPLLSSVPAGDVYWCGSSSQDTNSGIDWNMMTTPQAGAGDRSVHCARGKCLGGSSARNFMIYQRGTVGTFKRWADAVNDPSYLWENLQQYFQKSVQFTPPNTTLRAANASTQYDATAFSANGGPLTVSYANFAGTFSSWMQGAFSEIGIPTAKDFNTGVLSGAQYCASTIDPSNGNRESSQTAFVPNGSSTSNLKVISNTLAKKIIFNNTTATGVMVTGPFGISYTISARKEVILSAGAFQSPQLLMASGVGPAATLNALLIPVIADRPGVGQNMIDHVFFGPSYRVNLTTFTRLANDPLYTIVQSGNFFSKPPTGPLTNPVADFLAWENVPASLLAGFPASSKADLASMPSDWPAIEYLSGPGYIGNFASLTGNQPKDGYQYATILGAVVAPFSRGNVTIISADTSVAPIINPNWLTHPTDQQVAIAAFKRARAAFQSKSMSKVLVDLKEYYPGPQVQTDAQILSAIQQMVMTVWHASCTCKMGVVSDPMAVVDSHARVFGVQNLRVVDASSFALLPPGHPQSAVYMLAEKIAANILAGQ